uniref:uncharacterized protein LOC120331334 n=1 Tax=Styela clava TaxID=7725 RepID=UPI00193A7D4B|nr:uncharacterized protein LOC120331334 [Styela clava]
MDFTKAVIIIFLSQLLATIVHAQDIFIQPRGSGFIESIYLQQGLKYEFSFPGLPNPNAIIVFDVFKMEGIRNRDFMIYKDVIGQQETPFCMVYHKKEETEGGPCYDLWRTKYGRCTLNSVTDENCTVAFNHRGQEFEMEYKIIDCKTGSAFNYTGYSKPTRTLDKTTDSTKTASSGLPENFLLATVIPAALVAIAFVAIVIAAACFCKKKSSPPPIPTLPAIEEDPPIYEEIPANYEHMMIPMENAYNHLDGDSEIKPESRVQYTANAGQDKDGYETPVMRLLPPRDGRSHF